MTESCFSALGLAEPLQRALTARNHVVPTPIQARAIPELLAGRDMLGIAQTGTGKTAAFALPILHQLATAHRKRVPRSPHALILAPTRELAIQIGDEFRAYGKDLRLRQTVIFGGVGQKPQVDALARGVDILIATPGRLLDLMGQGRVGLEAVAFVVLDEADRMLDMGFVRDVRKIVQALPESRQSLLFSATMPGEIGRLSSEILTDPARVEVTPQATPVERIDQHVYHVDAGGKRALLARLLADPALSRVIVFTRTKYKASRLAKQLVRQGIAADSIHGDKTQNQRTRALAGFQSGKLQILVATDVASRGIDVDDVSHVINYDLPNEAETYVHRIGRTGRAGADGAAISFCDSGELAYLQAIERLQKTRISVTRDHAFHVEPARPAIAAKPANGRKRTRQGTNTAGTVGARPGGSAGRKPSSVNTRRKRGTVR